MRAGSRHRNGWWGHYTMSTEHQAFQGTRGRAWGVCVVLMALSAVAASQQPAGSSAGPVQVQLRIRQQPLPDGLRSFAEQTGLEVAYRTEEVSPSVVSRALIGRYTPEAA